MTSLMLNHAAFSVKFPTRLCSCHNHKTSRLSCSLLLESIGRASLSVDHPSSEESPGKERRKQRNVRREELKGQRVSFREVFEEKALAYQPPKKLSLKQLLNLDRLEARGMQWWIVCAHKNRENLAMENLSKALSTEYPELDFQVWSPLVPKELSRGKYSKSLKCLVPGYIYLRCILNKELFYFVRRVELIRGFIGPTTRYGKLKILVMPATVSKFELDMMHAKVKAEEETITLIREETKRKLKEENLRRRELNS